MMKAILKISLVLLLCLGESVHSYSQDSVKKAPDATLVNDAKPPVVNRPKAAPQKQAVPNTMDTARANALKAQMDPAQLNDKTLNGQYQYLLMKTYRYQQPLLAALWKNFSDTLNHDRALLKEAQAKIVLQRKLSDSLKTNEAHKEQSQSESSVKSDSISLLGVMMSKSSYNVVMFSIVLALAAALTIVILTTAKHKHEAKHRTELYEEIEEEFKAFKAKAHEKELKLARELQTERNKLDELLGRG